MDLPGTECFVMLSGVILPCELCLVSLVSQFGDINLFVHCLNRRTLPSHFSSCRKKLSDFLSSAWHRDCSVDPIVVRGTGRSHRQQQDQPQRAPSHQARLSHPFLNDCANNAVTLDDVRYPISHILAG